MEMDTFNLSWITEELAIGGCFDCERARELVRDHRVGAIIDLRSEACDDEALLHRHGVHFLHLPTPDTHGSSREMLDEGVAFAEAHIAAGRRVLVHCHFGIGRSATLVLCVLVARGMGPLEALALAKTRRGLVSPSPSQYEAWAGWLAAKQREAPTFEAFAEVAYRHLRQA
ncbi:MAG TPA: dual specificity protein phosphatase family protein [Kofleriaceae bacterium]|nr:dual specificity protein phosphatase family protein [Kofleriaceae bacterium]